MFLQNRSNGFFIGLVYEQVDIKPSKEESTYSHISIHLQLEHGHSLIFIRGFDSMLDRFPQLWSFTNDGGQIVQAYTDVIFYILACRLDRNCSADFEVCCNLLIGSRSRNKIQSQFPLTR